MTMLMASSIFTPTLIFSSSSTTKSTIYTLSSSSAIPPPKGHNFHFSTFVPHLGLGPFSSWNGLRHLGISVTQRSLKIGAFFHLGRKGRRKGNLIFASLFGVGAPEALVIGVVALLVFGPKGLAEVARNLGKTLREFQPTIRELQEVSKEFKINLEKEIGLDEISSSVQETYRSKPTNSTASTPVSNAGIEDSKNVVDPNGVSFPNQAYSSEELQKAQTPPPGESQLEPQTETSPPLGAAQEGATAIPKSENPKSEET